MMGICLDTDQNNGSQVSESPQDRSSWNPNNPQEARFTSTPPEGQFPMHNGGTVQFEIPKVPVIFVLGGPGSGKVTHCDNLMQEKRGVVHINMTDLLQQYAIGNDMQDFANLSSKTVTEVLMLEMKMAPNAKTYIISGYPRNMRDVVEYSEKIQVVNGVILVAWRQKVLERQVDYGAKLGQVVLSLAQMELNNFFKNVMPVVDYFDQSGMLTTVNGERHPGDVYKDFREAIMKILGMQDNPPILTNGTVATITNSTEPIVDRLTNPGGNRNDLAQTSTVTAPRVPAPPKKPVQQSAMPEVITVRAAAEPATNIVKPTKTTWPSVIWVIGGPGSNKAKLCTAAASQIPNWVHLSVGQLLRTAAIQTDPALAGEVKIIRQSVSEGDMVPPNIVMQLIETQMGIHISATGVIIDGFPRNLKQANEFEMKFKQKPTLVLLDCSKLQLGRGRLDDSVSAFRRRLELFREHSLPMLKSMDNDGRLTIVDGDTDLPQVQEEFNKIMRDIMEELTLNQNHIDLNRPQENFVDDLAAITTLETLQSRNDIPNGVIKRDTKLLNGDVKNVQRPTQMSNGFLNNQNKHLENGHVNNMANSTSVMNTALMGRNQLGYNDNIDTISINHM